MNKCPRCGSKEMVTKDGVHYTCRLCNAKIKKVPKNQYVQNEKRKEKEKEKRENSLDKPIANKPKPAPDHKTLKKPDSANRPVVVKKRLKQAGFSNQENDTGNPVVSDKKDIAGQNYSNTNMEKTVSNIPNDAPSGFILSLSVIFPPLGIIIGLLCLCFKKPQTGKACLLLGIGTAILVSAFYYLRFYL